MSKWLSDTKQQVLLWNLAIMFCVFYSIDAIATAFVSVMIDTTWDQLTGTQRWIRVALIMKAWSTAMLAFFTNSAKKIQANEFPISTGNTEQLTKDQIKQQ